MRAGQLPSRSGTLASWTLPAWESGRSRAAWRTKNTRMRAARRSSSAPAKLPELLAGGGVNLLRYSTLRAAQLEASRLPAHALACMLVCMRRLDAPGASCPSR